MRSKGTCAKREERRNLCKTETIVPLITILMLLTSCVSADKMEASQARVAELQRELDATKAERDATKADLQAVRAGVGCQLDLALPVTSSGEVPLSEQVAAGLVLQRMLVDYQDGPFACVIEDQLSTICTAKAKRLAALREKLKKAESRAKDSKRQWRNAHVEETGQILVQGVTYQIGGKVHQMDSDYWGPIARRHKSEFLATERQIRGIQLNIENLSAIDGIADIECKVE